MKATIMILGAGRYYLKTIQAAKELGYRVFATDRNPSAPGLQLADIAENIDIANIEGSVEAASRHNVKGVLAVNDFGVPTASAISKRLGLIGISPESAKKATDKFAMKQAWEAAGVRTARFRIVKDSKNAIAAFWELGGRPVILKPVDSRGGASRGVSRASNEREVIESLEFAQQTYDDKRVIMEEFLQGTEHSVEVITVEGRTSVIAMSDKEKSPLPFRVDKKVIYPTRCTKSEKEKIAWEASRAVKALGITTGAGHIELCVVAGEPWIFELGARCGGGGIPDPIVPHVTGVSMAKAAIQLAMGESPGQLAPRFERGCVYHFLTPTPGTVKSVSGIELVRSWDGILDCELFIKKGDIIRPLKTGLDRAGFVISAGATRQEAIELGERAEATIQIENVESPINK